MDRIRPSRGTGAIHSFPAAHIDQAMSLRHRRVAPVIEERIMKSPYIAFSLEPTAPGRLTVSNMSAFRVARYEPFVDSFSLRLLDERGAQATAEIIGKYVLMMLNDWNPDAFKAYPNLVIPIPPVPKARTGADDTD
jgi:hypothetical protein